MTTQTLTFEQFVNAPPSQVYHAFTNATALREWMCDFATVNPKPGGRFYAAWNSGYYACGAYTNLKEDEETAFTWYGRDEPGPTQVRIRLTKTNGGTLVNLSHEGLGVGDEWAETSQNSQRGWQGGLENLASVLETGEDQRFTSRPMLGITVNDFTPEQANTLGVPVTEGIRIDNVVEGMGAQAAGLNSNDVIVDMAGHEIDTFQSMANALQGKRAGDKVEVVFYRGEEKKAATMELSRRPIPEIPDTLDGLAEAIRRRYTEIEAEIDKFFETVTEKEASFKPKADEWNVKEVLAHLIQGERFWQFRISELVGGYERRADDYGGNLQAWITATVAAYPSLALLIEELKRTFTETVAIFPNLPEEFAERKGSFWRLAYEALEAPYHYYSHFEQMSTALDAAREK